MVGDISSSMLTKMSWERSIPTSCFKLPLQLPQQQLSQVNIVHLIRNTLFNYEAKFIRSLRQSSVPKTFIALFKIPSKVD